MASIFKHQIIVPSADQSDPKEVFAFMGLCAYFLQELVQSLIRCSVVLKVGGQTSITREQIEAASDGANVSIFDQLVSEVRAHIDVPADFEERLKKAARFRYYIAHRFFASHDLDFASSEGRREMIVMLRKVAIFAKTLDGEVEQLAEALKNQLGLSEEIVNREFVKLIVPENISVKDTANRGSDGQ